MSLVFPPPLRIVHLLTLAGTGRSVCINTSDDFEMLTNRADERKLTDEKEEKIVGELDSGGLERD